MLPFRFVRWAFERVNAADGQPAVLYFHPWEVDPGQPRVKASLKSRLRHYANLETTAPKVRLLLKSLKFAPMGLVLNLHDQPAAS